MNTTETDSPDHHTGSDEGRLSKAELAELDAVFAPFFRADSGHGRYVVAAVERILAARAAALDALRERVEAELHHAEDNGHHLSPDCQGVAPNEHVPAVRVSSIRAALADPTDGTGK